MPIIVIEQVAWSVGLSPAENLEAIEIPFAFMNRVGPGKHLLHIADLFEANTVLCIVL